MSSSQRELSKRYAHALFDLAKQDKLLRIVEEQLEELADTYDMNAQLQLALTNPLVNGKTKQAIARDIAKSMKLSSTVTSFFSLVVREGRVALLPSILSAFRLRMREDSGHVTAEVTAAQRLTSAQEKDLSEKLRQATGAKDIALDVTVDETLIGGLTIRIGSVLIDHSLNSRLTRLQQHLQAVRLQ